MDKRTVLAIVLMLIVALLPSILFPPKPAPTAEGADTVATATPPRPGPAAPAPAPEPPSAEVVPALGDTSGGERLVVVEAPLYRLTFTSRGARPVEAVLKRYRSFAPNDTGPVQLLPPNSRFLSYRFVFGNDTLVLDDFAFEPSADTLLVRDSAATLEWVGRRGPFVVRLRQTFAPNSHLFDVTGRLEGDWGAGLLLVALGPRIVNVEADSVYNIRSSALVTKAASTESVRFSSLDPGAWRDLGGPFEWVAVKSRYFAIAVLVLGDSQPRFGGAVARGGPRANKLAPEAEAYVSLPMPAGSFRHAAYFGPQEFRRLARIGHDFEDINPYGWIFRPIIRPFANAIVWLLLWTHERLDLAYGWVLVLFGIAVRVLLWPLNQKAMRSSMAMQALQPQIKALQERYKDDKARLQQEMMQLYREHKVNPFGGCLPMLLPMPVLFALFFVFRETIEFRGVPFLWIPDLSRADPLYVVPVLMGASMFVVTKIGQRGMPPNPQAKMMLYFMPAFLTFIFLNFSAGLNLYYAVSNIASIPQQWLVARERLRRGAPPR